MNNKDYCELATRNREDAKERHARLMVRNAMNKKQREAFDTEFAHLDIKKVFKVDNQIVTIEQLSKTNWNTCIIHPDGSYTSLNYKSSNEEHVITSVTAQAKRIDGGTRLLVQELGVQINGSKRIQLDHSGWYQPFTENKGKLFRAMQKEHGRCTGKMYAEDPNVKPIGWVFEKNVKHEDSDNTYLLETWVELRTEAEGPAAHLKLRG